MIHIDKILLFKQNPININHKDPSYDQKQIIIKEKKHTIERGDKSAYLITLVLTPLSLIV
jgi:hypothetical protein